MSNESKTNENQILLIDVGRKENMYIKYIDLRISQPHDFLIIDFLQK